MNQDSALPPPSLSTLQLAWLQEIGLDRHMLARWAMPAPALAPSPVSVPLSVSAPVSAPAPVVTPRRATVPVLPVAADTPKPATVAADLPADWAALQGHAQACETCDLHRGRSAVVFGDGVLVAPDWMIVGEAPGASDDRRGLPFQGKPGQLLRAMLASIGVGLPEVREGPDEAVRAPVDPDGPTVFCTNVIKCRPLGNRTPSPEEIAACMPYLQQQINLLRPRRILALGQLAAQALSGIDAPLEQLRGRVHQWVGPAGQTIPLVVTWHPTTLLLRPQHKADVWSDLNLARSALPD